MPMSNAGWVIRVNGNSIILKQINRPISIPNGGSRLLLEAMITPTKQKKKQEKMIIGK
jgi:hypothetical protein